MSAPNFFLIGAPKAGTTSLFAYLSQHPEIYTSKQKETRFFVQNDLYEKGMPFYLKSYFEGSDGYSVVGEGTPAYLGNATTVIPRIKHQIKGDIKFIVVLRNPVDRAWSNYQHRKRDFSETMSFEEALADEENRERDGKAIFQRYFTGGLYGAQLEQWFTHYDRKNFLVLFYEELKDIKELLRKICEFLEVDPLFEFNTEKKSNVAAKPRWPWLSRLKSSPPRWVSVLFRNLVPLEKQRHYRTKVNRLLEKPINKKDSMEESTKSSLSMRYREDKRLLEELLNIKIDAWK